MAAQEQGFVGLQGKISAPPPSQGATISFPTNGRVFTNLPVEVTGICPANVLVKLFKNNVFTGSAQCIGGNFTITTDLFIGTNELVARVFDDLDQQGPDSNRVQVTFNDANPVGSRISITSNYAKRGMPPGSLLNWPLVLTGGTPPYAISIDWGDRKSPDLLSRQFGGEFTVSHTYDQSGIYNIIIKVTDKNGNSAFLQLVGVGTGPISQDVKTAGAGGDDNLVTRTIVLWWPVLLLAPLIVIAFWLGHRNQMHVIRRKIINGQRPF